MRELIIVMAIVIIGIFLFYILYRNGLAVVNTKSALFYMSSPRLGKGNNCIEEKFVSCNGSIKRVIRLSRFQKYQFVFSPNTTKGLVTIEIYGAKKELVAKLHSGQPCALISAEKRTHFRIVTKFVNADGECKLIWNEV